MHAPPDGASAADVRVADAPARNWVDRSAPRALRPYLRLARLDRPIGTWLLLWPCWWSLALAAPQLGRWWPDPVLMLLFALGAIAMRGAGCTYNDIVDRDIDARVARTQSRPIPSGAVTLRGALAFLVLQCLIGLGVLLALPPFAILLGLASLLIVALYPFAKRVTYWPQIVLGLAFNWGALLGWAAELERLGWAPALLYLGGIAWTIGYDTIYAHQDREDDLMIGVKSSALRLGRRTRPALVAFYGLALLGFIGAAVAAGLGIGAYLGLGLAALHLFWQIARLDIDDPARCLSLFKSNRDFGLLLFLALIAGAITAAP